MDLVNTTPVPASIAVNAPPDDYGDLPRTALLTAKATFTFDESGAVELDRSDPYPLHEEDQEIEFGILPRDDLPRVDDVFEVMLLGAAVGLGERPLDAMTVGLSVGGEQRTLSVFGDRVWDGEGDDASISQPKPFTSMPLTWERALGGTQEILIDVESPMDLVDPMNPVGRGFDHIGQARLTALMFKPPEGYPRLSWTRELPNLEDPKAPIRAWDDAPIPACWAPVPLHFGIVAERLRRAQTADPDRELTIVSPEIMQRAHPDWIIPLPPGGAPVRLDGLFPTGVVAFDLPALRVLVDVRAGDETQIVELPPRSMVVLSHEKRFTITYRHFCTYEYVATEDRTGRIRLEEGWYEEPAS